MKIYILISFSNIDDIVSVSAFFSEEAAEEAKAISLLMNDVAYSCIYEKPLIGFTGKVNPNEKGEKEG